jgi:hypothetical protein
MDDDSIDGAQQIAGGELNANPQHALLPSNIKDGYRYEPER